MDRRRGDFAIGLLLSITVLAAGDAHGNPGGVQLSGKSVLAVPGCGADRVPNFAAAVTLRADGTWSADSSDGDHFDGTWAPIGAGGRKLGLSFDDATAAGFVSALAEDIGALCEAEVTVSSSIAKRFTLQLNRRLIRAKLVLTYVLKGRAGNRSGTARYRVRAAGPFVQTI